MERSEWIQHCANVNRLLRQIRDKSELPFTHDEETQFLESLDANELGIAFDLLCWKLEKTSEPISPEVYDLLADAGSRMKFPTSTWEKLKVLITPVNEC